MTIQFKVLIELCLKYIYLPCVQISPYIESRRHVRREVKLRQNDQEVICIMWCEKADLHIIVDDTIMLTNMHVADFLGNISSNSSDLTELKVHYIFFQYVQVKKVP